MKNDIQEPQEQPETVETEEVTPEEVVQLETQAIVAVTDDAPELAAEESAVMSQLNLESLINRYLKDIDSMRDKLKAQKTMLDDAFNNDAEYAQAQQKVKEATKAKKGIKEKIQKQPALVRLTEEVEAMKAEYADLQSALSSYLQQYQTQTGMNQFTGENGEVLEIVTIRKLVRRQAGRS